MGKEGRQRFEVGPLRPSLKTFYLPPLRFWLSKKKKEKTFKLIVFFFHFLFHEWKSSHCVVCREGRQSFEGGSLRVHSQNSLIAFPPFCTEKKTLTRQLFLSPTNFFETCSVTHFPLSQLRSINVEKKKHPCYFRTPPREALVSFKIRELKQNISCFKKKKSMPS